MIFHSYPIRFFTKAGISLVLVLMCAWACKKETDKVSPTLQPITENGFAVDSIIVPTGYPYKVGISAGKGDAAITNLVVKLTNENGTETALDSGMYSNSFRYTRSISYGASKFEKWEFMIRDKNGKSASTSITIIKDPASTYGPVKTYADVKLVAQDNTQGNSFYSLANGISYPQQDAGLYQQNINIITYFGNTLVPSTEFTLSSPGESDVVSFYPFITSWAAPRNETRYKPDSLTISQAAFEAAYNDSLIITNYTSATTGKRKFKMARAGYVIPFHVTLGPEAGKRGLVRIKSLQNSRSGYIIADIKVQK